MLSSGVVSNCAPIDPVNVMTDILTAQETLFDDEGKERDGGAVQKNQTR